jgi:hypothetical protein
MAAEDHNGGRSPWVNPTKVDHSLDNLARGLATGTVSRGKALRLLGAALLGGALASVPGFAWAQPERRRVPPSADCEAFCTQAFPAGPERAQCLSQGAQGSGPCYECNVGLGVSPPVGPHFECPSGSVIDTDPQFENCCHNCADTGGVLCEAGRPDEGCYSLQYHCGNGGTFDASNCQCVCPPGAALCIPGVGVSGCCVNGCQEGQTPSGGQCYDNTVCSAEGDANATRNPSTCECDCSNGFTSGCGTCFPNCPSGQTLNPETCQCE